MKTVKIKAILFSGIEIEFDLTEKSFNQAVEVWQTDFPHMTQEEYFGLSAELTWAFCMNSFSALIGNGQKEKAMAYLSFLKRDGIVGVMSAEVWKEKTPIEASQDAFLANWNPKGGGH